MDGNENDDDVGHEDEKDEYKQEETG